MSEQIQYLTPNGLKELEAKLDFLRNVRRQEVAARLHQALEEGGELVENAEYEDAKNEQAFVEGEIMRLETILSNAHNCSCRSSLFAAAATACGTGVVTSDASPVPPVSVADRAAWCASKRRR